MSQSKDPLATKNEVSRNPRSGGLTSSLIAVIGIFCAVSAVVNLLHAERTPVSTAMQQNLQDFLEGRPQLKKEVAVTQDEEDDDEDEDDDNNGNDGNDSKKGGTDDDTVNKILDNGEDVKMGYLSCKEFGGPEDEFAQEMVYWKDIESDRHYVSPFHVKKGQHRRYMTFEPDGGGWNNM
jgi:hypothetical protein